MLKGIYIVINLMLLFILQSRVVTKRLQACCTLFRVTFNGDQFHSPLLVCWVIIFFPYLPVR